MTPPPPVARLGGVSLRYKTNCALDRVDLEVPAGRMIGLIGPDGVGKSSLLALVSGARRIQSGTIEVLGGDMASRQHRRAVCPLIAYMPQGDVYKRQAQRRACCTGRYSMPSCSTGSAPSLHSGPHYCTCWLASTNTPASSASW